MPASVRASMIPSTVVRNFVRSPPLMVRGISSVWHSMHSTPSVLTIRVMWEHSGMGGSVGWGFEGQEGNRLRLPLRVPQHLLEPDARGIQEVAGALHGMWRRAGQEVLLQESIEHIDDVGERFDPDGLLLELRVILRQLLQGHVVPPPLPVSCSAPR